MTGIENTCKIDFCTFSCLDFLMFRVKLLNNRCHCYQLYALTALWLGLSWIVG